jgi:osmoprotectant transport system substrate-binding protein
MDLGLLYRALVDRQVDVAVGSVTDGPIEAMKLAVLADDRHVFPPYEAAPIVRADALTRFPALREALTRLGGTIAADAMRRMNHAVDGDHRNPATVVREWREQAR